MDANILGVSLDCASYKDATQKVLKWSKANECRYICAANVHMVMEAWDFPAFKGVVNAADLVTPDGMPLVWILRRKGHLSQQRVYGPTLMLHLLEMAEEEGLPVGFLGGEQVTMVEMVSRLKARFPGLNIAFTHSPPFRELTPAEDLEIITQINRSGAAILFVGLGCPKQEYWMSAHRGKVNTVMVGVGAAFNLHAGRNSQAPPWMQNAGLEWLYRLFQEPGRLWRRYLIQNPRFVVLAAAELLGMLDSSRKAKK